jgi:CO/xanthine dehydrogenase Mo-binding subunit
MGISHFGNSRLSNSRLGISRRGFVTSAIASGIAVSFSRLAIAEEPPFDQRETLPGRQGWNPAATGAGRIDGVAKVAGSKLYPSDFRAADMPGWPSETSHAILVRAPDATHVYMGLDLSRLTGAARPSVVVTAADLVTAGTRVPEFYTGDLLCPVGRTPLYLGQPVALLLFDTFDAFDQARLALRDQPYVKFGEETGPVMMPDYGAWRFTRVGGPTPEAPDVYSPLKDGWIQPPHVQNTEFPVWTPQGAVPGSAYEKGAIYGQEIRAELAADNPALLVLEREFNTQSIDPVFLEPECGMGWYDSGTKKLELVLGVQSPYEAAETVAHLLGKANAPSKPTHIDCHFAYLGGGFGGKDHTPFPMYVALAAMFFPGRPIRLAHDRFQQFQGGIKRNAFTMKTQIGVDRTTGKIVAFAADHVLHGGGLANFAPQVATVGACAALGIYYVPKVDITTVVPHSRAVTTGSMRGYGTLQTMTALEVQVDEICTALPLDPIEFRRRNALLDGGRTITGNPYIVSVRTPEILDKLEKHPIWQQRGAEKARGQQGGKLVGTGVACATKDYGTGADATLARVTVDPAGRITIHSDYVEMGTGIGTAIANRVASHLGAVSGEIDLAQIESYGVLELVKTGDPYAITQAAQDAAQRDPRWVPEISSASTASIGAHIGTHPAAEAARVVFRFGLWPAALELWGIGKSDPRAKQWETARWKDGQLTMPGLASLSLAALAAKAHAQNGVTGAMTHGFNRWEWAQATFPIANGQTWTADIDALAVRRGSGKFARIDRTRVTYPPTDFNRIGTSYTSMCGTLVRIEIDRATAALRIGKAYSVLECGEALVPQAVVGQAQGGFAMGVGYALLENLPLYEDGPGNGKWNLGQYVLARGSDLPLHDLEIEVLPPVDANERPKGIAEVVMIPIVAALLNAIFDATGHRFRSLPVTQAMLKGVIK